MGRIGRVRVLKPRQRAVVPQDAAGELFRYRQQYVGRAKKYHRRLTERIFDSQDLSPLLSWPREYIEPKAQDRP